MTSVGSYIPQKLPTRFNPENASEILEYGPIIVDFAPCEMTAEGIPTADDPLGRFMEYYRKENPSIESNWNLTCHASEVDLLEAISQEYKVNRLAAYIISSNASTSSLTDPTEGIDYTFMNHISSGLNYDTIFGDLYPEDADENEIYKGVLGQRHSSETTGSAFLSSITLTLQFLFEDTAIKFKTRNFPDSQSPGDISTTSTLGMVKAATPLHKSFEERDGTYKLLIPLFLVILVSNSIGEMTTEIVSEKQGKFKSTLSLAGLPSLVYFTTWLLTSFIFIVPCLAVVLVVCVFVFSYTSSTVVVIFFISAAFGWCSVAVFVSSIFQTVVASSVFGTVIIWALSSPSYVVLPSETDPTAIHPFWGYLLLLLPPSSYAVGVQMLVLSEARLEGPPGIHWSSVDSETGRRQESITSPWLIVEDGGFNPGLLDCVICNIIGSALLTTLSWYFDKVIPDQWGKSESLSFCFKKSYWARDVTLDLINDPEKMAALENLNSEPLEIDTRVKKLMPGISTKELRKVYGKEDTNRLVKDEDIVYSFGDAYFKSRKIVEYRLRTKSIIESNTFAVVIYLCIGANLIALMFDKENNSEEVSQLKDLSEIQGTRSDIES